FSHGELKTFPATAGKVNAIARDSAGNVWLVRTRQARNEGPLCRISNGEARCFGKSDGLTCELGFSIAIDAADNVWLGGSDGLCRFGNGRSSIFLRDVFEQERGLGGVHTMAADPKGALWLGDAHNGSAAGLSRFENDALAKIEVEGFDTHLPINEL